MKYTLQQPGRSIYKLEQSILKICSSRSLATTGLSSRVGQRTRFFLFLFFFGEEMVQSAAIKQGRSANRKHSFFFGNISFQIKVSHLFNTGGRVALSSAYF